MTCKFMTKIIHFSLVALWSFSAQAGCFDLLVSPPKEGITEIKARREGESAGSVFYFLEENDTAYVELVFIPPEFRRQGISRLLLSQMLL